MQLLLTEHEADRLIALVARHADESDDEPTCWRPYWASLAAKLKDQIIELANQPTPAN